MAADNLIKITLWLKAEEIAALQQLLVREGKDNRAVVMSEYTAAAAAPRRA
jgi:hypothetical protein